MQQRCFTSSYNRCKYCKWSKPKQQRAQLAYCAQHILTMHASHKATKENAKKFSSSWSVTIAIDCNSNGSIWVARVVQTLNQLWLDVLPWGSVVFTKMGSSLTTCLLFSEQFHTSFLNCLSHSCNPRCPPALTILRSNEYAWKKENSFNRHNCSILPFTVTRLSLPMVWFRE